MFFALSPAYEKLEEVVTHDMAKLYVDWPAEKQEVCCKSKLAEHFLPSKALGGSPPLRRQLEQCVQLLPAGHLLQGIGHTTQNAPETLTD